MFLLRTNYRNIHTAPDAQRALERICKEKKELKAITAKIRTILASIRDTPTSYALIQEASLKWIKQDVLPLQNSPKTKDQYLDCMHQFAACGLSLANIVEGQLLLDLSKKDPFTLLQTQFEASFGKAWVIPMIQFLMDRYPTLAEKEQERILTFLCTLPPEEIEEDQAKMILCETHSLKLKTKAWDIVAYCLDCEIKKTKADLFLRGDCLATKLFNFFCKREGTFWLNSLFSSAWKQIEAMKEVPEEEAFQEVIKGLANALYVKILKSWPSFYDGNVVATSPKVTLSRSDTGRMIQNIPESIEKLLHRMQETTKATFPAMNAHEKLISFVFLRVLGPCFTSPEKWGFVSDKSEASEVKNKRMGIRGKIAKAFLEQSKQISVGNKATESPQDEERRLRKTASDEPGRVQFAPTTALSTSTKITRHRSKTLVTPPAPINATSKEI